MDPNVIEIMLSGVLGFLAKWAWKENLCCFLFTYLQLMNNFLYCMLYVERIISRFLFFDTRKSIPNRLD